MKERSWGLSGPRSWGPEAGKPRFKPKTVAKVRHAALRHTASGQGHLPVFAGRRSSRGRGGLSCGITGMEMGTPPGGWVMPSVSEILCRVMGTQEWQPQGSSGPLFGTRKEDP